MKISEETKENARRMKELTEKAKELIEKIERDQAKESTSFLAINVAESDNELLFISGLTIGSISDGADQHYVSTEFVKSMVNQYKVVNC